MALSPSKSAETPFRSPKKEVTRYGAIKNADIKFGDEERFAWQNSKSTNDVAYKLPDMTMTRSVKFGFSLRKGMDDENPDTKKRSTGPGSYQFGECYDHLSEYARHEANRFPCAPRQSMAVKTPSPGAVYNIEKKYYNGPEKPKAVGFANASRNQLFGDSTSANADMFIPRADYGPAITIATRPKPKMLNTSTSPGAVYDVHVSSLSIYFHYLLNLFSNPILRKKLILELVLLFLLVAGKEIASEQ